MKTAIPEFEHPDSTSPEFAHESMLMTDEKRLCVLALSVFRSRLSDISIRDHVMLIWCVLGGRSLRAHGGNAYFYQQGLGAWETFMGLFPDYVLKIVKQDLLQVEGLFRAFDGDVPRTEAGLLAEIRRVFMIKGINTSADTKKTLDQLTDNAIFQKGNNLLRRSQGKGGGDA